MQAHELEAELAALTEHQRKVFDIIYQAGEAWSTRSNLARAMDKRQLNPYDIECLELLAARGLIEASTRPSRAPHMRVAHIYRATPDGVSGAHRRRANRASG